MHKSTIFYFHSLDLTFKSAQTLQVVKDYCYLSKLGIEVFIFGVFQSQKELDEILEYIQESNIRLIANKNTYLGSFIAKTRFLFFLFSLKRKVIVSRHYRKLSTLIFFKRLLRNCRIVHEMHEESIPHLFKAKISKQQSKELLLHADLDCIVFTNYSQLELFEKEFGVLPDLYKVIPNGVEVEKFKNVSMSSNFVLTYAGQFNRWKNVELIFAALSLLPEKYSLRVAGGKGDEKSQTFIEDLSCQYYIDPNRVDYLGFVENTDIPNKVLHGSNVLLLPLGDNIQSQYLTSPMKLFEYMATQIPVLAVDFPSVRLIAEDNIFYSANNPDDFADQLKKICHQDKFDFTTMNNIAKKYSYPNRAKIFAEEVIGEI